MIDAFKILNTLVKCLINTKKQMENYQRVMIC